MNTSVNMTRIKDAVEASGIEYEIFAEACGKSLQDFKRQMRLHRMPPLSTYIAVAKVMQTNIDYLIGFTENSKSNKTYDVSLRLKDRRKQLGYTLEQAANAVGSSTQKIRYNEIQDTVNGIESLAAYAKGYKTSTDYLLGFTDYLSWDTSLQESSPFYNINAGDAFWIAEDHRFGYMSSDGTKVYLENGTMFLKDDPGFHGKEIISLKEKQQSLSLLEGFGKGAE